MFTARELIRLLFMRRLYQQGRFYDEAAASPSIAKRKDARATARNRPLSRQAEGVPRLR